MGQLPLDRTLVSTPEDHLADHLSLHALHDLIDAANPAAANIGTVLTVASKSPLALAYQPPGGIGGGGPASGVAFTDTGLTVLNPAANVQVALQLADAGFLPKAGAKIVADNPALTVNGARFLHLLAPSDSNPDVEGYTFKTPGPLYGQGVSYASGQPFLLLNDSDSLVSSVATTVSVAITAIANSGNPAAAVRLTVVAHGAQTGDNLGVVSSLYAAINLRWWRVIRVDADHVDLVGSTAGGAFGAGGLLRGNVNPVQSRIPTNGGAGFVNLIHVAVGLRGQSRQAMNAPGGAGFGSFTAQPSEDLPGFIVYNPPTTDWSATPVSPYFRAYDIRTSPTRIVFDVEPDGLLTMRSQVGKAATGSVIRVRDASDASDIYKVRVDGGLYAGGPNHGLGGITPTATVLLAMQSINVGDTTLFLAQKGSQTADIIDINDATFLSTFWRINKNGYMGLGKAAAPASGDVHTSEYMPWWKDTVGAAGLQIRGKDSGATVIDQDFSKGTAVTAPTGGATIDTQSRTAINQIIAHLQRMGIAA